VITPQLQQAIKLLQLTNLELEAYVEAELERNPLLQRDERDSEPEPEAAKAETATADYSVDSVPDGAAHADMDAGPTDLSPGERDSGDGDGGGDAGQAGGQVDWSRAGSGGSFEGDDDMEGRLTRAKTLSEHLHDQLAVARLSEAERVVAAVLIDAVDDGGYLRADLEEISLRLGCDEALTGKVLAALQGFEPTGVFARDVRECLALQLKDRNRLDPAMEALLDNLELLARRDLGALRKACGVDDDDIREMIAELKALTPRPGAAFGGEPSQPVTPDVFVREGAGGMWLVELNTDTLPRVLVDKRYHARISGGARSDADKTFVSDCLANANWLVKSLDQRARTILKVSSEIVRQQDGFLAYGVEHLRPLNLKTVADAIGMHESTVSRVTSNKYIATPRGMFELKFFFSAAIQRSDGGNLAGESVRRKLEKMVADEDPRNPLSDNAIVEALEKQGIEIARRTVAKYREQLGILPASKRKRLV
jgi:RNA polymerase sigma-54 factor